MYPPLFFFFSPEILKHEMKVFFVKYNDPIYVKLEKLDIMIRLASQANIAQVNKQLSRCQWRSFTQVGQTSVIDFLCDV